MEFCHVIIIIISSLSRVVVILCGCLLSLFGVELVSYICHHTSLLQRVLRVSPASLCCSVVEEKYCMKGKKKQVMIMARRRQEREEVSSAVWCTRVEMTRCVRLVVLVRCEIINSE
mmetsp:Transcript_17433/g.27848  ORF Transcript_17433/g.27848 Transcript_17433/m.27848 type:complete len:116 (-) Transcript_17433:447-794(-)